MGGSDRLWVPHPEFVYLPCQLKSKGPVEAVFADIEGNEVRHPVAKIDALDAVCDSQLDGVDNICDLETVNQAAVLHTVRTRFFRPQPHICTRVSRIVIAVNPFKVLPIYSSEQMHQYMCSRDSMDLPPHIFAIGQDAVLGLRSGRSASQAVLVSGESGAGKTESTKLVLSYVAAALSHGGGGGIEDKVMQINPILESFGNAMTLRNNNSSRFGKWVEVALGSSSSEAVAGCTVTDYLLELTRVCSQGPAERNYHVFFQIVEARAKLAGIQIGDASSYRYTRDCLPKAPGIDDASLFEELKEAFSGIGFSEDTQLDIFRLVCGILNLGNADFADAGNDCCSLSNRPAVDLAAECLGVSGDALEKSLTTRSIKIGKDVTESGRKREQAVAARDSLARLVYGKLFKFLIAQINKLLAGQGAKTNMFFGILDIAGFESFETNSLEQICINLSNEHLQSHFNNHVFKTELSEYKAEGIDVGDIKFEDNTDIISLIDSKVSILAILDEEVSVPKATDLTFVNKVTKAFGGHPRYAKPKGANDLFFGVVHFAGQVTYSVKSFLEKNVDKPPEDALDLFQASKNSVLKEIGETLAAEAADGGKPGGRPGGTKKSKTVSSGFRASLQSLVSKLNEAEPHFVRCVKPNAEKVPDKFTSTVVMDQLKCSGVLEAVRIRQSGYASRLPFAEFVGRYVIVVPKSQKQEILAASEPRARAEALLAVLPKVTGDATGSLHLDVKLGNTKVFCRTRVMGLLDRARDLAVSSYSVTIQRRWRGHQCRKLVEEALAISRELRSWRGQNSFYGQPGATAYAKYQSVEAIVAQLDAVEPILARADRLSQCNFRQEEARAHTAKMQSEVEALQKLRGAASGLEPLEMERALVRARGLGLAGSPDVAGVERRLQALKLQIPLLTAARNAVSSEDDEDVIYAAEEVAKAGLLDAVDGWIPELQAAATMEQLKAKFDAAKARQEAAALAAAAAPAAPAAAAPAADAGSAPGASERRRRSASG